jgi:SynChlorMet cassette protein ScmC
MTLLALADGGGWSIAVAGESAARISSRLVEIMQLRPLLQPTQQLIVLVEDRGLKPSCHAFFDAEPTIRVPISVSDELRLALVLMKVTGIIGRDAQSRGGALLHGALAEKEGGGVILAGPGEIGKTTASRRLRPPWRSLCDDTTLVVCDKQGKYWAHPWPTLSKFMANEPLGTWDVQHAVPLKGLFFLSQADEDRAEPLGAGQAACLLVDSAEEGSRLLSRGVGKREVRALRVRRFENICALVQSVPCFRLRLGLKGAFWDQMARALA